MSDPRQVTLTLVDAMTFRARSGTGHEITVDCAEAAGGADSGMRPTEALLVAVGACGAMDVASLLRKMRQRPAAYEVDVVGAQRDEHPRVYTQIEVTHRVTGPVTEDSVQRAIALSIGRYCPVYAMLSPTVPITVRYEIRDGEHLTAVGEVTPGDLAR